LANRAQQPVLVIRRHDSWAPMSFPASFVPVPRASIQEGGMTLPSVGLWARTPAALARYCGHSADLAAICRREPASTAQASAAARDVTPGSAWWWCRGGIGARRSMPCAPWRRWMRPPTVRAPRRNLRATRNLRHPCTLSAWR
jgi:hypothetical protein